MLSSSGIGNFAEHNSLNDYTNGYINEMPDNEPFAVSQEAPDEATVEDIKDLV